MKSVTFEVLQTLFLRFSSLFTSLIGWWEENGSNKDYWKLNYKLERAFFQ